MVAIWMLAIFVFSSQPATESSLQSAVIVDFVKNTTSISLSEDILTFIVRKSAHIFMYFVLGILLFNAVRHSRITTKHAIFISIVMAMVYAMSDEIHQTFVPGRSGEIGDVLIDTIASSVGIGAYYFAHKLHTKRKIHKNKSVSANDVSDKDNDN
jgi:VanZ family protein